MPRPFYGWTIVAIAALAVFLSGPGQTYSVTAFVDPLIAEFGWSRSLVSGLYSGGTLLAGLLMTAVGRTVDRRGYRIMLTTVALAFAGALLLMSSVWSPAALFAGFLLIRTFGQGSLTLIPYSMVPQWFLRRRGRALSVLAVAGALSAAALPYLNLLIIEGWGWRAAWRFWAAVLALGLAPIAWLWTRERPEALGLRPDGVPAPAAGSGSRPEAADPGTDEEAWTLGEAARTPAFWVTLALTAIPSMVGTGAAFHHMSILAGNGVAPALAATVFTVGAATHLAVTPMVGYLSDRWPVRYLLAASLWMTAVGIGYLLFASTPAAVLILGVLQGCRMALFMIIGGLIWPHFFGRQHLASIRGVTTAGMVIASALGPLPFGAGYDWFGGYREVILAMAALPLAGSVAALFLKKPVKEAGVLPAPATATAAGGRIPASPRQEPRP